MKTFIIYSGMFVLACNFIMAQPKIPPGGGQYLKTVEYNVVGFGATEDYNMYNLKHKSEIDRFFFGIKNSFVEFVFTDSFEGSNEATALRIVKNPKDSSYELEVMRLQNLADVYGKLNHIVSEKATQIFNPSWLSDTFSEETKYRIIDHNQQANILKYSDELYKPYRPEPLKFQISRDFSEKLHKKTSMLIEDFKGVGIQYSIKDCFRVTFRCVVEDEVWTLSIHCPQGGNVLRFSDLFRQIITDSFNNKIDETKYLKLLDEIL